VSLPPFLSQLWEEYDEEAKKAAETNPIDGNTGPTKTEYLDIIISDVHNHNGFGFSVQILNTEGMPTFSCL
jgi:staphylococcal nuclease domain-containing protein 1